MSVVPLEALKGASDTTIIFATRVEPILTAQIRHDSLLEFLRYTKTIKIVNDDAINSITYRTQSPSNNLRTVPPNSEDTLDEWTSYLEINPDVVTGAGSLEMDLVNPKDALK